MKQGKFASLKQKIICIPIIMMTLISFIIPNYAHAGVGNDIFNALQELMLYIPDSIIAGLEKFFLGNNNSEEIIITNWDNIGNVINNTIENGKESKNLIVKAASYVAGGATSLYDWWTNTIPILGDLTDGIWKWGANTATNNFSILRDLVTGLNDPDLLEAVEKYSDEELSKAMEEGENVLNITFTNITYSPKLIFENQVPALDANFFKKDSEYKDKKRSTAYQLKNLVATWYVALRNIALVIMLLILVFIGIKITISSVSSEKAKYKQLLVDWIVAICLLVFLHYIMIFAVNIVEMFTNMISSGGDQDRLLNLSRMKASNLVSVGDRFYWTIIYVGLIIYTLLFTWKYLKRVVKLAFLTLFAPIMAAFYPIDKMTDGQAQGFNKWLKDYVYELFIQPLHLLLYTILISSVDALAESNPVYALVAFFSFMTIEKMLREYLGFEKGHVKPPNPAGLLTAATLGHKAMDMFLPSNVKSKSGKISGGDSSGGNSNEKPVTTSRGDSAFSLLSGGNGENKEEAEGKNNINGMLPGNKPKEDELKPGNKKGFGLGPIFGKKEDWNSLKRTMNGGYGLGSISTNKSDWDALKAAQNMQNKRNIKKPASLRKNIGAAGRKVGNSKFARGVGAVGRKYGGKFVRKLTGGKSGVRGMLHAAGGIAKFGTKVAAAATVGTYAGILGAMEGPENAAKLGIGGLATGYAIGGKAADLGIGILGKGYDAAAGVGNTFMSGADPAGYDRKLQEKEQRRIVSEIRNNDAAMRAFRIKNENMSDKDITAGINECVSQGIDNVEDMQTVFDLEQKAGIDRTTAMGAVKISKDTSASELRDEGKTESLRKSIERNLKGADAERQSYDAIDMLRKIHKVDPMESSRSSYAEAIEQKQKKAQEAADAQRRAEQKERRKKAKEAYEKKKSEHTKARNEAKNSSGGSGRRGPKTKL